MLASEMIKRLGILCENIKAWNILYQSVKDLDFEKLTTLEDCVDCLRIYDNIMEGAAFLPDWVKILAHEADTGDWLVESQRQEFLATIKECVIILAMDRPEPMAGILREFRPKVINRAMTIRQFSTDAEDCALLKMFTGGSLH